MPILKQYFCGVFISGRLIIPILNAASDTIGFAGRVLPNTTTVPTSTITTDIPFNPSDKPVKVHKIAKYVNSPNSPRKY